MEPAFTESHLGTFLDLAPDAVVITDTTGAIVFANKQVESLFGYDPADLLGNSVEQLLPEHLRETHVMHRAAFAANPNVRPMGQKLELLALRSDGESVPVEVSLSPVSVDGQNLVCASVRDASEKVEVQAALTEAKVAAEHTSNMKSRFLAAASHDLRQPLQAVSIYTALLRQTFGEQAKGSVQVIDKIETSLRSMSEILDLLLNLTKLDTGVVAPERTSVELSAILRTLQVDNEPNATKKGLSLDFPRNLTPCTLNTDPGFLQRILENLISNAIRYTNEGRVSVEVSVLQGRLLLSIRDTGIGIPTDQKDKIFQQYYQIDGHSSEHRQGYGLGLSMVQQLADALGYRIKVDSTPGLGSTFTVEIPDTDFSAIETNDAESQTPPLQQKILVVEDDQDLLEAMGLMLELSGLEIVRATGSRDALSQLTEGLHVGLIVTDFHLVDTDGLELIKQVQALHRSDLPSILITGDAGGQARMGAANVKNCTLLKKPIVTSQLIKLVEHHLKEAG